MNRFEAALTDHFADSAAHPQHAHWLGYARASVARGQALIDKLHAEFLPWPRGLTHLDVGSGWGGTCLAAAKAGMASTGLEPGQDQRRLAAFHTADHPGLTLRFLDRDAMDWAALQDLGPFDLITADNVIEHVAHPERLIAHLARLLKPDGLLYLTLPNGQATGQVRADCHYGLFGASLLDPAAGAAYVRAVQGPVDYDVSWFHPWETYAALFAKYGLDPLSLLAPSGDPAGLAARRADGEALKAVHAALAVDAAVRAPLDAAFAAWLGRLETDLAFCDALTDAGRRDAFIKGIDRDYGQELWYVVARPLRPDAPFLPPRRPLGARLTAAWRTLTRP